MCLLYIGSTFLIAQDLLALIKTINDQVEMGAAGDKPW